MVEMWVTDEELSGRKLTATPQPPPAEKMGTKGLILFDEYVEDRWFGQFWQTEGFEVRT